MNKSLVSGLVLLCFGVVCGLLLAIVNHFTAPVILANEQRVIRETIRTFFADVDDYDLEEIELEGDLEMAYLLKDKTTGAVHAAVYRVSAVAYNGRVNMLIAIDQELVVAGYSFIDNSGTEGLGLNLANLDFGMGDKPIAAWAVEFDTIAGATITSQGYAPAYDGGVRNCFALVAERVGTDFGGDA